MESNKETRHQKSRKKRKHKKNRRIKPSSSIYNSNSSITKPRLTASGGQGIGLGKLNGLGKLSSDFERFPQLGLDLGRGLPDISQSTWFWENYHNAMGWQGRHEVAYWRSRALASEHQNNLLLDYVENNSDGGREMSVGLGLQCQQSEEQGSNNNKNENYLGPRCTVDSASSDSESFVFEVNEEMLSFFELSMKHKTELKKQREEEKRQLDRDNLDAFNARPLLSQLLVGRLEVAEKTSLYGKNATTIIALETLMQLAYERYLDEKKPKLWPNIPLKL